MIASLRKYRSGFTLVELLVVISIIALLIAILLPSMSLARKQARALVCQTSMRALSTAAFTYSTEYGVYPPSLSCFADSPDSQIRDLRWNGGMEWLGIGDQAGAFQEGDPNDPQSGNPKGFTAAPRFGALWPYVKDEKAYLCPSDKPGKVEPNSILGGGGNGKFSFTIFSNMGLQSPESIPSRFREISGGSRGGPVQKTRLSTRPFAKVPIFVEEHPAGINDRSAAGNIEGNFNFETDFVVSRHPPYTNRPGFKPGVPGLSTFKQGSTNIGFADGHVEAVKVNFGFSASHFRQGEEGDPDYKGIPYTAAGLLYYYGIEYKVNVIK